MALTRGTTPTIKYTFNTVDVSRIVVAYLSIKQSSVYIEYDLTTAVVDTENSCISWTLTQADTLQLNSRSPIEVQIRYRLPNNIAGASAVTTVDPYKILKDGEI